MIIKGSARGQDHRDAARLARHLLADENELVRVMAAAGVASIGLAEVLEEMRLLSLGTRARHALYHASISVDRQEASSMTDATWLACVDELGRRLGMAEHQRVVVQHVKHGRKHVHVVFARVHPMTLRIARDSHNYRKHEECSRALEARYGLHRVLGAFTRPTGTERPVAKATHDDWQAAERTGIAVDWIATTLRNAWTSTRTGEAFRREVEAQGLSLASGRRGIVVVDAAGTPHSIPRRLGLRAAEVRKRLADIDIGSLPLVEAVKVTGKRQRRTGKASMKTRYQVSPAPGRKPKPQAPNALAELEAYWRGLGYAVEARNDVTIVTLPTGTQIEDHGDRLTLVRDGEPQDHEIALMVSAAKARGWDGIRFSGSSPEWQRRARLEALRQGWPLEAISLESEDSQAKLTYTMPMPDHIKKRLMPPELEPADKAPMPDAAPTAPVPEYWP